MNTDWLAYLIVLAAAVGLILLWALKHKSGSCCRNSSCLKKEKKEN